MEYSSIAYALILKDVGVLIQTLNMMATDMGSADVRPGANIDLFAKMTGIEFQGPVGQHREALEEVRFMPYGGLTPELTSVRAIADLAPWGRLVPKPSGGEGRIPKLVNSSGPGPYRFFGSWED